MMLENKKKLLKKFHWNKKMTMNLQRNRRSKIKKKNPRSQISQREILQKTKRNLKRRKKQ